MKYIYMFAAVLVLLEGELFPSPLVTVQSGHNTPAYYLAVSNDQRYAITSSNDDRNILLWDVATWKQMRTIASDSSSWGAMKFSADSKSVVYAADNFDIVRRDVITGRELSRSKKHVKTVNSVDISADGRRMLSASDDGTIILWDAQSGRLIKQMISPRVNPKDDITRPKSVQFSPDGKLFVTCGVNSKLTLWNTVKGTPVFEMSTTPYEQVRFSPDGKKVLSFIHSFAGPFIDIWSITDGKQINTGSNFCKEAYGGKLALVRNFGYSSDGSVLYLVDSESLLVWDAATLTLKGKYTLSPLSINCAALMHDNNRFFGASKDGLFVYDLTQQRISALFGRKAETLNSSIITDKRMITANSEGYLSSWNIENLALEKTVRIFDKPIDSLLPFPDGKTALVSARDKLLKIVNLSSLKEEKVFSYQDNTLCAAVSHNGKKIARAGLHLYILDATTGREIARGGECSVNAVKVIGFTADDRYVMVSNYGTLMVYDSSNGKLVKEVRDSTYNLTALAVSPDGKYVITGSENHFTYSVPAHYQMMILNTSDFSVKSKDKLAQGLWSRVVAVGVSPDSRLAAVTVADKSVVIIELATGKKIKTFTEDSIVNRVSFSADMKYLVYACNDGTTRLRFMQNDAFVAMITSVKNNQWLVFDSDGYWDASSNGGDLVAMVQGTDCWNIDQFAVKNNRPDLIMEKLPFRSASAKDNYYRQYLRRLKKTGVSEDTAKSRPAVPETVINRTSVNGNSVEIALQFKDSAGKLRRYNLFVNDVPVFSSEGKSVNGKSAAVIEKIELAPGVNKIEASCANSSGIESYRAVRYVTYQTGAAEKSDLYFIGFGVSKYRDNSLNLAYASKDVTDLADSFRAMTSQYKKIHIQTYTDSACTAESFTKAKDLLKNARADDTVVLFIAGHGVHDTDAEAAYYFLTHEADRNNLINSTVTFEKVESVLSGIAPRKKLFLMDTCESGEIDDKFIPDAEAFLSSARSIRARSADQSRAFEVIKKSKSDPKKRSYLYARDRYLFNDITRRTGAIVFSSCRGGELSYESELIENGYFTEMLMRSFKSGDADNNGSVSVDELRRYVSDAVSKETKGAQNPVVDRDNLYQKFGFPKIP